MRHHRTQKSSKHKKIKAIDPFYSGPRRQIMFKADKNANKPPSLGAGVQEVPRRLRDIVRGTADSNKQKPQKRKAKGLLMHQRPDFKQGKYETLTNFYRRMDKAASDAITKAELEMQFDVHFDKKGKNKLTIAKKKDPVTSEVPAPKVSKSQKRKLKLQRKVEEKMAEDVDEFAEMADTFTFGEVVDAPPDIKAAPHKAPERKKGGKKNLLLLKSVSGSSGVHPNPDNFNSSSKTTTQSISSARQEQLRQESVQAYRQLKKQRNLMLSKPGKA
ncbi:coiled-coil domain-containing protein 137-like [Paramacrobiotus metropolitanus]|uniref:coiled-coil domain-containing protein 137-like n=1 Tax=Paramacrobiotus metropolitanus TaxID=2943436 RepID=UPI002445A179|nr:coiled-coil domain-containing protein 137-like [Paramacrobiotus metropolitanus]